MAYFCNIKNKIFRDRLTNLNLKKNISIHMNYQANEGNDGTTVTSCTTLLLTNVPFNVFCQVECATN